MVCRLLRKESKMLRQCVLFVALFILLCTALNDDGPKTESPKEGKSVNRVSENMEEEEEDLDVLGGFYGGNTGGHSTDGGTKAEFKEAFAHIDKDNNEALSIAELVDCIMEIDSGREKKKLKGAWTRADADRDGFVTHKEFVESVVDGEAIAEEKLLEDEEDDDDGMEWTQVNDNDDNSEGVGEGVGKSESLVAEDKGESEGEFQDEGDIEQDEEEMEPPMSEHEMLMEEKEREKEREMVVNRSQPIFKMADQDQDGHLNFEEFLAFAVPESYPHMLDVLVDMYRDQYDADKDGYVSIEEFKAALLAGSTEEEEMPDWVQEELDYFNNVVDKDSSGQLDLEELKNWARSKSLEVARLDAQKLMKDADEDKDEQLTVEEIMNKTNVYDLIIDYKTYIHMDQEASHDFHDEL